MKNIIMLFLFLSFTVIAHAQEIEPSLLEMENISELDSLAFDKVFDKITTEDAAPPTTSIKFVRVENEFYYVLILAALCLISLSIVLSFLLRLKHDAKPKDVVSGSGLIIIVFGTIILVLIVDTSEQLTAAIGILGAIAGYLFRSAQEDSNVLPVETKNKNISP